MEYTVLALHTTGLDYDSERIIEIGAIKLDSSMQYLSSFQSIVKQDRQISSFIVEFTGINETLLLEGLEEDQAMNRLDAYIGDSTVVSHNAPFVMGFITKALERHSMPLKGSYQTKCTLQTARDVYKGAKNDISSLMNRIDGPMLHRPGRIMIYTNAYRAAFEHFQKGFL